MGSALGCANQSKDKEGAKEGSKDGKYTKKQEDLPGKIRYLGDIGAAIHVIEEKEVTMGHFLVFVGVGGQVTFACHTNNNDKMYVAEFTDEAFLKKKEGNNISLSYNAVFKSIVTETAKGKVKLNITDPSVTAAFSISSVKDAKANQKLEIVLEPTTVSKHKSKNVFLIEPISRMIAKKRLNDDEKEKEMKVSKMHLHGILSGAGTAQSRATIDRVQKIIVPLREKAAMHSKVSSETMANVEQFERRIRKLKHRSTNNKNPLDEMYEKGGARHFHHLPDAEEHLPILSNCDEMYLDWLKAKLPLKEKEKLASLKTAPSNPLFAKMKDPLVLEAMGTLGDMDSWSMSMFDLEKSTNGNALYVTTYALLHKLDLVSHFDIDDKTLRSFLKAVQSGYHPNPYHNKTHAADVAQIS